MRDHEEAETVLKSKTVCTIAVSFLALAIFCLCESDGAVGEDASHNLQILFLANSKAHLEPCG